MDVLQFPCRFEFKVIGYNNDIFRETTLHIVKTYFEISEADIDYKLSKKDKYLSITITVHAESQEIVDYTYVALSASENILMAL